MAKTYINITNEMLKNNIEPDAEDFYLADIEAKANSYDNLEQALIEIKEYMMKTFELTPTYKIRDDILEIIDKVLEGE